MGRKFFRDSSEFIKTSLEEQKSNYLIGKAALDLCRVAEQYNYYIEWYECGILHENNGQLSYEGHDTWTKIKDEIQNTYDASLNNIEALRSIEQDLEDGYDVFSISIKKFN